MQEGWESNCTVRVRRGGSEEIALIQGKAQRLRFAGAAKKRYRTSKLRSSAALSWNSREEIPQVQGKRNPSKMVGVARGIRGQTH